MQLKNNSILIIIIIFLLNLINIINCDSDNNLIRPKLKFNKDRKFKIVQFTDLHYGEDDNYDELNLIVQEKVISMELPDFVMFSGDMFSSYNIFSIEKYYKLWEMITRSLISRNIPWSITFGNHDCEGPLTGREIVSMDKLFSKLSLTEENRDPAIPGITNYNLKIYSSSDDGEIASSIYIFDSDLPGCNETGSWGCIDEGQVEWYKKVSDSLTSIPSVAFVHIPPLEVIDLWNEYPVIGDFGDKEACCYYTDDSKFIDTMIERGDIKGLYFGHDHKNDFHGLYKNSINLGYGRKSGYGSYNPKYLEGARIIELTEPTNSSSELSIETWIRTVDGGIDTQRIHFPNSFSKSPLYCCTHEDHSKFDPWPIFISSYCFIIVTVSLIFYKIKVKKNQNTYKSIIQL